MDLPMLPQDKANHVVAGAVIATVASLAAVVLGHAELARSAALIAAGVAGALKEGLDYALNRRALAHGLPPPHDVEFLDFLATLCGGLLVSARP